MRELTLRTTEYKLGTKAYPQDYFTRPSLLVVSNSR